MKKIFIIIINSILISNLFALSPTTYIPKYKTSEAIKELIESDKESFLYNIIPPNMLKKCILYFKNGLIYDEDNILFNTSETSNRFVMDEKGIIYVIPSKYAKIFINHNHTSFLDGKPVASSGYVTIKNGEIIYLEKMSGHYRQKISIFMQVFIEFYKQGIRFKFLKFKVFGVEGITCINHGKFNTPKLIYDKLPIQLLVVLFDNLKSYKEIDILNNKKIMHCA